MYEYKNIIIFKGINYNRLRGPESKSENNCPRKLHLRKDRDIADRVNRLAKVVEVIVRSQTSIFTLVSFRTAPRFSKLAYYDRIKDPRFWIMEMES